MRPRLAGVLLLGLLGVVASGGSAPAGAGDRVPSATPPAAAPVPLDREIECLELVPDSAGAAGVTDRGQRLRLDVLVYADGVPLPRARQFMARAATAYRPLQVDLVPRFVPVRLPGEGRTTTVSGKQLVAGSAPRLIDLAKARTRGARPKGVELVYVLTAKDLFLGGGQGEAQPPPEERGYGLAGLADCIGGVRFADRAFAVGELFADEDLAFGPSRFYADATAEIAAHELGHLLGAHHHYANCGQGAGSVTREVATCTTMFNSIDLTTLTFGVVEGAVIRGHAAQALR